MSETKLLPCPNPWCASTNTRMVKHGATLAEVYWVRCMCGVRGPVSGTKKDAIALWNTRALTPETINKEMYAYLKKMRDSMRCVCGLNELGFQLGSGVECHVCAINAILKKADGGVA